MLEYVGQFSEKTIARKIMKMEWAFAESQY